MSGDYEAANVFVGIDVGKSFHHAVALARSGEVLLDRSLANDESDIRALLNELSTVGPLVVAVDQPSDIGALAVAVARDMHATVAYLPGLAMRRLADLHPGSSKSDRKDAYVIAQAARTLPHALRSINEVHDLIADLRLLCSYDDDLVMQVNRTANRLRALLTRIHPALERVIGPRLSHPAVLELLLLYPSPGRLHSAGQEEIERRLLPRAPRIGSAIAAEIDLALTAQTVVVPGSTAVASIVLRLAEQLQTMRRQREEIADHITWVVERHPQYPILASMPGIGVGTSARILSELGGRSFPSAGHLAAFVGLAPVSHRSGTSVHRDFRSERGNRALKRALRVSAFTAVRCDALSRSYFERKVAEGKTAREAIVALMRRRLDVIYAMMREEKPYRANDDMASHTLETPPVRRAHRAKRGLTPHDPSLFVPRYAWVLTRLRAEGFFSCNVESLPEDVQAFRRGIRSAAKTAGLRIVTTRRGDQLVVDVPDFIVPEATMRALSDSMGLAAERATPRW